MATVLRLDADGYLVARIDVMDASAYTAPTYTTDQTPSDDQLLDGQCWRRIDGAWVASTRGSAQDADHVQVGMARPTTIRVSPGVTTAITRDTLLDQLAAVRYATETQGTTLPDGTPISTERPSMSMVMGALIKLQNKPSGAMLDWKGETGWISATLPQIQEVWNVGSDWVQRAFSAERVVAAEIDALADETLASFDVAAAFAEAFATKAAETQP